MFRLIAGNRSVKVKRTAGALAAHQGPDDRERIPSDSPRRKKEEKDGTFWGGCQTNWRVLITDIHSATKLTTAASSAAADVAAAWVWRHTKREMDGIN